MMGFRGVVTVFLVGIMVGIALLVAVVAILAAGEESKKEDK